MPRDVGVVIVAAGQGTRAGGEVPKQFRLIGGVPMVLRALRPFTAHPEVAAVSLVLPAADAAAPPAWLRELAGGMLALVAGGAERRDSVRAGLRALPSGCRTVLVHDGARPFVARPLIDAVLARAREGVGAVPAMRVSDSLKEADTDGCVVRTVPRHQLWRAQTPQGFPRELLERAYAEAGAAEATDDATLVERVGGEVYLVPGSSRNIKVTTPEDLQMAELLARDGASEM